MKFCLATNFDPELIDAVNKYDSDKSITEIFGKLAKDIIGGGRHSFVLPKISWKDLANYVSLCHKNKLKFNYLMNALCTSNMEYENTDKEKY